MAGNCSYCGAPALGDCETCGRAFCHTHQARESNGIEYLDQCEPCRVRQVVGVTEAQAERSRLAAAAHQWVWLNAVDLLRRSGAPTVEIARVMPGTSKQLFRRAKSPFVLPEGLGWLLSGLHGWFETAKHLDDQDGIHLRTLVLLDAPGLRLRSVSFRPDFDCYEPEYRGSFAGNWVRLKASIDELLASSQT